jgi:hypothetical protein
MLISNHFLIALLRRWNIEEGGVELDGRIIKFRPEEMSVLLGLRCGGQNVRFRVQKTHPKILELWDGMHSSANRVSVERKLLKYAKKKDKRSVQTFVKLYNMLIFGALLFPTQNFRPPRELLHYLDNIDEFENYDWGKATFDFLMSNIPRAKAAAMKDNGKGYIEGCSIALLVSSSDCICNTYAF